MHSPKCSELQINSLNIILTFNFLSIFDDKKLLQNVKYNVIIILSHKRIKNRKESHDFTHLCKNAGSMFVCYLLVYVLLCDNKRAMRFSCVAYATHFFKILTQLKRQLKTLAPGLC